MDARIDIRALRPDLAATVCVTGKDTGRYSAASAAEVLWLIVEDPAIRRFDVGTPWAAPDQAAPHMLERLEALAD
jgi:hypothetical protein